MEYASFGKRLIAYLIDSVLLTIIDVVLFLICFIPVGLLAVDPGVEETTALFASIGLIGLIFALAFLDIAYFVIMDASKWQGTLGKRLVGIQIVNADMEKISFGQSIGRNLIKNFISNSLCFFGFILALFTKEKQCLHDLAAKTYCVNKR